MAQRQRPHLFGPFRPQWQRPFGHGWKVRWKLKKYQRTITLNALQDDLADAVVFLLCSDNNVRV